MVILVAVTAVTLNSGAADGTGGGEEEASKMKVRFRVKERVGRDHLNNVCIVSATATGNSGDQCLTHTTHTHAHMHNRIIDETNTSQPCTHTRTILACSSHDHGSLSLSSTGLC